jgi:hypothetical protein
MKKKLDEQSDDELSASYEAYKALMETGMSKAQALSRTGLTAQMVKDLEAEDENLGDDADDDKEDDDDDELGYDEEATEEWDEVEEGEDFEDDSKWEEEELDPFEDDDIAEDSGEDLYDDGF